MSETLIPTMALRFVERDVPATLDNDGGVVTMRRVRILQQLFNSTGGVPHWRDVPCINSQGSSEGS